MCMLRINDLTYSRIMWPILYQINSTKFYEDNVVCTTQIKGGFVKGDKTSYAYLP